MEFEKLKKSKYVMKYADECNYIIENFISESGQANCLQGELLRECEKLRHEAQVNGNYNWDKWFEYFCDHIRESLVEQVFFSTEEKQKITEEVTEEPTTLHVSPVETVSAEIGTQYTADKVITKTDGKNTIKIPLSEFIEDGDIIKSFTFVIYSGDGLDIGRAGISHRTLQRRLRERTAK